MSNYGARRKVETGGRSPGDMFDLDEFVTSARDKSVEQAFSKDEFKRYDKALADLEKSITEKNQRTYPDAEKRLSTLLNLRKVATKIKQLIPEFNRLVSHVKQAKSRGNWFHTIKVKDDSRNTPVSPDLSRDDKSGPKSQQTDVLKKLLAIEKMLEDAPTDVKGAAQKKPDTRMTDDVLEAIQTLCTKVVKDRAKSGTSDVSKEATAKHHLKVAQRWMTNFEKQMKAVSSKDDKADVFKHELPQSNELDNIREILVRLIGETRSRETERKALEENHLKQAKLLLSLLTSKEVKNEENSTTQLLEFSTSEINKQIDVLTNLATRLNSLSQEVNSTNEKMVSDKKKNEKKPAKQQNNTSVQIELLTAICGSRLQYLEEECGRNQTLVAKVDDEIEHFEKELEDWNKSENIPDLDKNIDKCLLKALRSARMQLHKYKKEKLDKSKQENMKNLTTAITKLCKDNGIDEPKKKDDKYVDMIQQLEARLKKDQEALEDELTRLQGDAPKKGDNSKLSKNKTEQNTLLSMAQTAKRYMEKLQQDQKSTQEEMTKLEEAIKTLCYNTGIADSKGGMVTYVDMIRQLEGRLKSDQDSLKTLETELRGLQGEVEETQKGSKASNTTTEISTLICMAQNANTNQAKHKKEYEEGKKQSLKEMKDLENALLKLEKGVHELTDEQGNSPASSTQAAPSLLNMVENIQKEFVKYKGTHMGLKTSLQERNATMQRFAEQMEPHLNLIIDTLTQRPQNGSENLSTWPEILQPIVLKVLQIKSNSTKCLTALHDAFEIIIGSPFQMPAKRNRGEGYTTGQTIEGDIMILADAATSKKITGDNVLRLTAQVREIEDYKNDIHQLERKVSHWKAEAKSEEKEKLEYMTRLSKVASAKLTDNNPNIADLSDPNRQTKLAEEYGQLYDNEWTNAYEDVEKAQPKESEESRINYLLQVLMTVYNQCVDVRTQQLTGMKMALLQPAHFFCLSNNVADESTSNETGEESKKKGDTKSKKKPKEPSKTPESKPTSGATKHNPDDLSLGAIQSQAITELGKQTYSQALQDITKYFQRSQKDWFNRKYLAIYTTKCIEICWLMNIHSPPVYLDDSVKTGAAFDKTKYREYTARGKKVKFLVWPTILLHKDGPTMGKGVAQGMG